MTRFSEGDKVYYIPDHAEGPKHPDAEAGRVVDIGPPVEPHRDRQYWVDYYDGAPVGKMTYERHLIPMDNDTG